MEAFFPTHLLDVLVIAVTFSFILMALIQKFKTLAWINKSYQIWILNLIFSFAIGIPFAMSFYELNLCDGIWVGVFSFIGAPSIYAALKNQNIINYKPSSVSDVVTLPKENEIKRTDLEK